MRYCPRCDKQKIDSKFQRYRANGTKAGFYPHCYDCKDTEFKPDAVPKGVKKFCHNCWNWKPLRLYRRYLSQDKRSYIHSDYCKDCEGIHGRYLNKYDDISPAENDWEKSKYYCAFIGNTPYKEICKVYGIRYEKQD